MDGKAFDQATQRLAAGFTRRSIGRGLIGVALGAVGVRLPIAAEGKKTRKKNRKQPKLQRNAFNCVSVGKPCRGNDANCCSGICQGKKPKKGKKDKSVCIAHDVLDCQADQDQCVDDLNANCGGTGRCFRTTGNASFCGIEANGDCAVCAKDADCEPAFGRGAACIVCAACENQGGPPTACAPPTF